MAKDIQNMWLILFNIISKQSRARFEVRELGSRRSCGGGGKTRVEYGAWCLGAWFKGCPTLLSAGGTLFCLLSG